MTEDFHSANAENVKSWLDGSGEYLLPSQILADLTEAQATVVPPDSPYSIAQIVAHLHYWQGAGMAKRRGDEPWPKPAHLSDTFAAPEPGAYDALVKAFLADLDEIKALADAREDYDYVSRSLHNGYHLGQIVLLRQMQGLWPPSGGDDNDF